MAPIPFWWFVAIVLLVLVGLVGGGATLWYYLKAVQAWNVLDEGEVRTKDRVGAAEERATKAEARFAEAQKWRDLMEAKIDEISGRIYQVRAIVDQMAQQSPQGGLLLPPDQGARQVQGAATQPPAFFGGSRVRFPSSQVTDGNSDPVAPRPEGAGVAVNPAEERLRQAIAAAQKQLKEGDHGNPNTP